MVGPGRMAEPDAIADAVVNIKQRTHDLSGETVLITAGPTQEPLDPVRYISNRSSGKMAWALADAASRAATKVGQHVHDAGVTVKNAGDKLKKLAD